MQHSAMGDQDDLSMLGFPMPFGHMLLPPPLIASQKAEDIQTVLHLLSTPAIVLCSAKTIFSFLDRR